MPANPDTSILPHHRPLPPPVARDWALFLDVDGCLVEFTDDPARTTVPAALVERLLALSDMLDGALALVSGRRIATLDRMFAPALFPAAGLHGLERRLDARVVALEPQSGTAALREAIETAREVLAIYPGALVEDKGRAMALHWRGGPAAGPAALAFAREALRRLPGYRLQHGDMAVELRPEGADKGTAIIAFMQHAPFRGRLPVFVGDDLTDEHGFAAVASLGGIGVLVGSREDSHARHALADPAAVRAWLGVREGEG
jgi:trehalose 6-phosphate phosphatase